MMDRSMIPAVGKRMSLREGVECYPHFALPAGLLGVVTEVSDDLVRWRPSLGSQDAPDFAEDAGEWGGEVHWCSPAAAADALVFERKVGSL